MPTCSIDSPMEQQRLEEARMNDMALNAELATRKMQRYERDLARDHATRERQRLAKAARHVDEAPDRPERTVATWVSRRFGIAPVVHAGHTLGHHLAAVVGRRAPA